MTSLHKSNQPSENTKTHTTMSSAKYLCLHLQPIFIAFLLFLAPPSDASSGADASSLTVYQVLEEYDFPVGLLPKGVVSYDLNSSTGEFTVHLNGSCSFSIDSYELEYSSTVTGVISTDKLTSLSGIKVKVWFFWLSIVEVVRESDELVFSVGIASADFPVSNFDECPTCGCGFDCDDVLWKRMVKPSQASSS